MLLEKKRITGFGSDFHKDPVYEKAAVRSSAKRFKKLAKDRMVHDLASILLPFLGFFGLGAVHQYGRQFTNNPQILSLMIIAVVAFVLIGVLFLQLTKKKIPSTLTGTEEHGFILYLLQNGGFTLEKSVVDGTVKSVREVTDGAELTIEWETSEDGVITVPGLANPEQLTGLTTRRRSIVYNFGSYGISQKSDKLVVEKDDQVALLVKLEGDHYKITTGHAYKMKG